jgi:hypothetical protein
LHAAGSTIEREIKTRDGKTVPKIGETWSVQGYLFEVTDVHPEPSWGVKERIGVFTGKALDRLLIGSGYDGGRYAY